MGRVADAKSASHGFLGSFVLEEEADMFMLKCSSGCGWLVVWMGWGWRARASGERVDGSSRHFSVPLDVNSQDSRETSKQEKASSQ